MGYTHYWNRKEVFDGKRFKLAVHDFEIVRERMSKLGVDLADGGGEKSPSINKNEIIFNGRSACGHKKVELGIAWPSQKAGGLNTEAGAKAVGGAWSAGATIDTRTCGGDCSHETFHFPRVLKLEEYQKANRPADGLIFEFCKTAYKPYDLAVTAALIIIKHYFPTEVMVRSDGKPENWFDGMLLCHEALGYGLGFKLDEEQA